MDDRLFDTLTRRLRDAVDRRSLLASLFSAPALGILIAPGISAGKKKCRKGKKRCGKRCVRGTCCPDKPCGGGECICSRSIEGKTFCSKSNMVLCEIGICASSDECGPGRRCVSCASGGETSCLQKCDGG